MLNVLYETGDSWTKIYCPIYTTHTAGEVLVTQDLLGDH